MEILPRPALPLYPCRAFRKIPVSGYLLQQNQHVHQGYFPIFVSIARRRLQLPRPLLHRPHHPKKIAAIDLLDIVSRITLLQQRPRQRRKLVIRAKLRRHAAHPIEVRPNPHMIDPANLHRMIDLRNDIGQRSRRQLRRRLFLELVDRSRASQPDPRSSSPPGYAAAAPP